MIYMDKQKITSRDIQDAATILYKNPSVFLALCMEKNPPDAHFQNVCRELHHQYEFVLSRITSGEHVGIWDDNILSFTAWWSQQMKGHEIYDMGHGAMEVTCKGFTRDQLEELREQRSEKGNTFIDIMNTLGMKPYNVDGEKYSKSQVDRALKASEIVFEVEEWRKSDPLHRYDATYNDPLRAAAIGDPEDVRKILKEPSRVESSEDYTETTK